jgi:hypothetical protein
VVYLSNECVLPIFISAVCAYMTAKHLHVFTASCRDWRRSAGRTLLGSGDGQLGPPAYWAQLIA